MERRILIVVAALTLAVPVFAQPNEKERRKEALDHEKTGRSLMVTEKWPEAEREFKIATRMDPLLWYAHYDLGQTYMATRRYPEAETAYLAARQAFEDGVALRMTDKAKGNARLEEELEQLRDSVKLFQSGAGAKVSQPENMVLRLEERIRQLEDQKGRGASDHVDLPPQISMALGSAFFRQNKLPDAQREWEAAVKVKPDFGEAQANLAVIYMMAGQFDESKAAIAKAEKAGYKVNPKLKEDLEARLAGK